MATSQPDIERGDARRSSRISRASLKEDYANLDEYGKLVVAIVENPMLNCSCIRLDATQRFAPK